MLVWLSPHIPTRKPTEASWKPSVQIDKRTHACAQNPSIERLAPSRGWKTNIFYHPLVCWNGTVPSLQTHQNGFPTRVSNDISKAWMGGFRSRTFFFLCHTKRSLDVKGPTLLWGLRRLQSFKQDFRIHAMRKRITARSVHVPNSHVAALHIVVSSRCSHHSPHHSMHEWHAHHAHHHFIFRGIWGAFERKMLGRTQHEDTLHVARKWYVCLGMWLRGTFHLLAWSRERTEASSLSPDLGVPSMRTK